MRAIGREGVAKLSAKLERLWHYARSAAVQRDATIMGAGLMGLRWVEVSRVQRQDVCDEEQTLRVRTAKGGRERTVKMGPSWTFAAKCLKARQGEKDPERTLFRTSSGKPVRYEQVLRRCKEWTKRETGTAYSFHCLRHSFAVSMYEKGMDVLEISRALGHKSLQWTATYLRTIVPCETEGGVVFTKEGSVERSLRIFNPEEKDR